MSTQVYRVLASWLERSDCLLGRENLVRSELQVQFGPERVIDIPVADRGALGFALGLALSGKPVCLELTSSRSLLAAAEILTDAASMATGDFQPALTLRLPVGGEAGAAIDTPIGRLVSPLPGLRVLAGTGATTTALLQASLGAGLTLLLEPRSTHAPAPATPIDPAALRVVREGTHATVAAWGVAVDAAVQAAEALADEGVSVEVVDLVSLAPLDPSLHEHVARTGRLIVAHPSDVQLAGEVSRAAIDGAFLYLESPPSDCCAEPTAVRDAVWRSVTY